MTTTQERRLEDTVLGSAAGRFYRHQNFGTGLLGGVGLGFLLWLLGEYTVNNNPNYGTDMVVTLTMLGQGHRSGQRVRCLECCRPLAPAGRRRTVL